MQPLAAENGRETGRGNQRTFCKSGPVETFYTLVVQQTTEDPLPTDNARLLVPVEKTYVSPEE